MESRVLNEEIPHVGQQLVPFVSATSEHVRLNVKWQEQLKSERERVRRSLITGSYGKEDDSLDLHAVENAVVTVVDSNNHDTKRISKSWFHTSSCLSHISISFSEKCR